MATKPTPPILNPYPRTGIPAGMSLHNYDTGEVSNGTATWNDGKDVQVQQHLRDEVDINTIMNRFMGTGVMPPAIKQGVYGDFSGVTDYWSALERIQTTETAFLTLEASVRERFDNDPGKLWEYIQSHSQEEFEAHTAPEAPPSGETPPAAT